MEKQGYLDEIVSKVISRKFLVWIIATILMFISLSTKFIVLSSSDWVLVSMCYIAVQGVQDVIKSWKGTGTSVVSNVIQNVASSVSNHNIDSKKSKELKSKVKKEKKNEVEEQRPKTFGGVKSE